MEESIHRILELDKESRAKMELARKKAEEIDASIPQKVNETIEKYKAAANSRVQHIQERADSRAQKEIARHTEEFEKHIAALDEKYEKNADDWCNYIVEQVTKE